MILCQRLCRLELLSFSSFLDFGRIFVYLSFFNLVASDTLSSIYYRNPASGSISGSGSAYGYNIMNGLKYIGINAGGSNTKSQRYQLPKELGGQCTSSNDCRENAYICSRDGYCECAEGYRPDDMMTTCVGGIGRMCLYDSHCIPRAYCKGQITCTCKREFPVVSSDEWSCEESSSRVIQVSSFLLSWNFLFVLLSQINV